MKGNLKPCLDCGRPTTNGSRCREHSKRPWYDQQWRTLSKETIIAAGPTCPRCGRSYTTDNPATLDHVKPRSLDDGVAVMCRECNSRKGDRVA